MYLIVSFATYVTFFALLNVARTVNEDTVSILLEYLDKNLDFVLNILKNSEQKYRKITNKKLIDAIINNKLENHYGSIELNPPTEEFEQLLIDALDRVTYKAIYTLTPAILKKCELTNNLAAAAVALKGNDPEEEKIIMAAIENGTLKYDDLRDPFLSSHESDIRILRSKIMKYVFIFLCAISGAVLSLADIHVADGEYWAIICCVWGAYVCGRLEK